MELLGGALAGLFAPAVVAGGGLNAGVSREVFDGGEVGVGVEKLRDVGAPEVVGREAVDADAGGAAQANVQHRLVADAPAALEGATVE